MIMGTRNTMVVTFNGKKVVDQYGQWDGYPTGQGAHILSVLRDGDALWSLTRNLANDNLYFIRMKDMEDMFVDIDRMKVRGIEDPRTTMWYMLPFSRDYGAGGILSWIEGSSIRMANYGEKVIPMLENPWGEQEGNYRLDITAD